MLRGWVFLFRHICQTARRSWGGLFLENYFIRRSGVHWPTVLLLSILYATLKYLSIPFDWGESLNTYEKLQDEASSDGVEVISYPFRTD